MRRRAPEKLKYLLAAALVTFAAPLSACAGGGDGGSARQGIVITQADDPVYAEESVQSLKDSVYALMEAYVKAEYSLKELTQQMQERISLYAAGITDTVTGLKLSAAQFNGLCAVLADGDTLAGFGGASLSFFSSLLGKLGAAAGFENTGALAYRLLLYAYDQSYDLAWERYATYGYGYLKTQAEEIAAEKAQWESEVGEDNFILAVQTLCALGSLSGKLDGGIGSLLSDSELLLLIKAQTCTDLTLSDGGWALLLNLIARYAESSYPAALISCAVESGDLAALCGEMNDVFALLRLIQSNMTAEQAQLLRQGQTQAFITAVFAAFGAEEWALFAHITGVTLEGGYEEAAAARFGQDFTNYADSVTVYSLAALQQAAGQENFIQILEGYLAGLSPALSYGLFHD